MCTVRLGVVHKLRRQVFAFFDHLPHYVDITYLKLTFWTTYPSQLVNVVCERPLSDFAGKHCWQSKTLEANSNAVGL